MFVLKKIPPFVLECFISDYLERRYRSAFLKITYRCDTQKVPLEKMPPLVLEFFKSDYLEWRYGVKTTFSKITWDCGYSKCLSQK